MAVDALRAQAQTLHDASTNDEINAVLQAIHDHFQPAVYVHPRVLGYADSTEEANSRSYVTEQYDQYRELIRKLGSASVCLGLFSTSKDTWVGRKADDQTKEWLKRHAWAAAIFKPASGKGKTLAVWDNEPNRLQHARITPASMLAAQRKLVEQMAQIGTRPAHLFYNTDASWDDRSECCVYYAVDWIIDVAVCGPKGWAGPEDGRLRGMQELTKK